MEVKSLAGITTFCSPVIIEESDNGGMGGIESSFALFANGSVVQSVCLLTGKLLGSFPAHKDLVTCIAHYKNRNSNTSIVSSNVKIGGVAGKSNGRIGLDSSKVAANMAFSSSIGGDIIAWDLETFKEVQRIKLSRPIMKIAILSTTFDEQLKSTGNSSSTSSKKANNGLFVTEKYCLYVLVSNHDSKSSEDKHTSKLSQYELLRYDISNLESAPESITNASKAFLSHLSLDVSASPSSAHAIKITTAITVQKKKLSFTFLSESLRSKPCYYELQSEITSIACSQTLGAVAVGLAQGQIAVLYNVSDFLRSFWQTRESNQTMVTAAIQHWHAHALSSLAFSWDGKLLYSGGEESVLVVWNLAKSSKSFLPRLGAPVCRLVSCKEASRIGKVLISTLDNTLRLVNTSNMETEWFWQTLFIANPGKLAAKHLIHQSKSESRNSLLRQLQPYRQLDKQSDKEWASSVAVDPWSGLLVTNGNPGLLQVFDCVSSVVRRSQPIVQYTRVSKKDSNSSIFLPSVTKFLYDQSGTTLITIDVSSGEELHEETSLKFWELDKDTQQYKITSQMDRPHGNLSVTQVAVLNLNFLRSAEQEALPTSVIAATASADGSVKVWRGSRLSKDGVPGPVVEGSKMRWSCLYSFQYRGCVVEGLAFSSDGSILVVAYPGLLTFWDARTVELKASIPTYSAGDVIKIAIVEPRSLPQFGGGIGEAYLVVATTSDCIVYSLLTLLEVWRVSGSFTACAIAQDENFIIPTGPKSELVAEGWIALAETETESGSPNNSATSVSITIRSPLKPTPLVSSKLDSNHITSLSFLKHSIFLYDAQRPLLTKSAYGLVTVTGDSDLLLVRPAGTDFIINERELSTTSVAAVKRAALPTITVDKLSSKGFASEDGYVVNVDSLLTGNKNGVQLGTLSALQTGKDWLKALFPESTEDLPRTSDIIGEFLRSIATSNQIVTARESSVSAIEPAVDSRAASDSTLNADSETLKREGGQGKGQGDGEEGENRVNSDPALAEESLLQYQERLAAMFKKAPASQPPQPKTPSKPKPAAVPSSANAERGAEKEKEAARETVSEKEKIDRKPSKVDPIPPSPAKEPAIVLTRSARKRTNSELSTESCDVSVASTAKANSSATATSSVAATAPVKLSAVLETIPENNTPAKEAMQTPKKKGRLPKGKDNNPEESDVEAKALGKESQQPVAALDAIATPMRRGRSASKARLDEEDMEGGNSASSSNNNKLEELAIAAATAADADANANVEASAKKRSRQAKK